MQDGRLSSGAFFLCLLRKQRKNLFWLFVHLECGVRTLKTHSRAVSNRQGHREVLGVHGDNLLRVVRTVEDNYLHELVYSLNKSSIAIFKQPLIVLPRSPS